MIQGLRGILLILLASLASPVQVPGQVDPEHQDPVRQAVRKYQAKVDQLEQLTRKVLADRKQQLADAEARLRRQQEEAAAVQRELQARNAQLSARLTRLEEQLANAHAERDRLQRSLETREAEHRIRKAPGHPPDTKTDARTGARLGRLEDLAARMEQWVRQLQGDVRALLRRSRTTNQARQEDDEDEEEEEEEDRQSPDIHIHNHGGSVILHFHGGKPRVYRHHDDDDDAEDADDDAPRRDLVGRLLQKGRSPEKGR